MKRSCGERNEEGKVECKELMTRFTFVQYLHSSLSCSTPRLRKGGVKEMRKDAWEDASDLPFIPSRLY